MFVMGCLCFSPSLVMASRVVVITGCSNGIGFSTAVLLAKDNLKRYKVYATMRNADKKGLLEESVKDELNQTIFIKTLDVTSDESVAEVLESVYDDEGRIDVLGEKTVFISLKCFMNIYFVCFLHPRPSRFFQISVCRNLWQLISICLSSSQWILLVLV